MYNNERSSNIRVYGRFRPFNKVEGDLTRNGLGTDCTLYPDDATIVLMPDNIVFTMDNVFTPLAKQSELYETVGKQTIVDVLNGYNGTIFAYGQTGSGKTYTMFGQIFDKEFKGLIPRSIEHIFRHIDACDLDIEFVLTCSMLEIYKETLYDLLSV
jgi:kinesin family protein 5